MLELKNLKSANLELTEQDAVKLYGGELENGPGTAAWLAAAAAGGYFWDNAKENITSFPSNVADVGKGIYKVFEGSNTLLPSTML